MKRLNKKGDIAGIQAFVYGIGGVAIVLAIVLIILAETRANVVTCSSGYIYNETLNRCHQAGNTSNQSAPASGSLNASLSLNNMLTKMGGIPNWIGILIVVVLASMVLAYFYVRSK